MTGHRLSSQRHGAAPALVLGGAAAAAALAAAVVLVFGPLGLAVPVALVGTLVLLQRPALAVGLVVVLAVMIEGDGDAILPALDSIYEPLPGGPTALELLLVVALGAVALDVLRRGEPVRVPTALLLPLVLLVLAIVSGVLTGVFGEAGVQEAVFAGRQLPFLVLLPLLVFHVVRTTRDAKIALAVVAALAAVKSAIGLAGVVAGSGVIVEGSAITYYEPAANALALLVMLGVVAAVLMRARLPLWVLLSSPLVVLALAFSFRRSFWVGAVLGLALVVVLGSSPLARRLVLPGAVLTTAAIWALSAVNFQVEGPLVERARSLEPGRVQTNEEDRYRLDERVNVLAEVREHPLTGLGLGVPWSATHPLGVEHAGGRQYVHMALLWHWLKLGLLGVAAYVAILLAAGRLAVLAWRRHAVPLFRVAGLAALCWIIAIAAVETTAAFSGVDLRFTVLLGAVLGLLAALRPGRLTG